MTVLAKASSKLPHQTRYRMTTGIPQDINFEAFIVVTLLIVVARVDTPCSLVGASYFGGTCWLYSHPVPIRRGPKGEMVPFLVNIAVYSS
jgi:hypothetical protein